MRLKYNILWFENDADFIDSARLRIDEFLEDLGFSLEIMRFSGSAFQETDVSSEKWNLILMDFDLGEERTGANVIEAIRTLNIPTEVIFYSSISENVENIMHGKPFEGIYWCNRNAEFDDKVRTVIELTLRKVMDVTNMRGLVMAECADIDQKMDDILAYCHNMKDAEGKLKFRSELIEVIKNSCSACGKRIGSLDPEKCDIETFQDTRVFTSFHKVKAVQDVTRPYKKTDPIKDLRAKFNIDITDVIEIRNNLAHVQSEIIDGKEVIVNGDFVFDKIKAKDVRIKLRDHIQNIETMFNELKLKLGDK